jgi:hypothetical protein
MNQTPKNQTKSTPNIISPNEVDNLIRDRINRRSKRMTRRVGMAVATIAGAGIAVGVGGTLAAQDIVKTNVAANESSADADPQTQFDKLIEDARHGKGVPYIPGTAELSVTENDGRITSRVAENVIVVKTEENGIMHYSGAYFNSSSQPNLDNPDNENTNLTIVPLTAFDPKGNYVKYAHMHDGNLVIDGNTGGQNNPAFDEIEIALAFPTANPTIHHTSSHSVTSPKGPSPEADTSN